MTGFRVAWGGAQARYRVTPDLSCLGKIIGGGMPLAAFGGRRDLMQLIAPVGPVYQAGTLSGNPISVSGGAGDPAGAPAGADGYDRLEALGQQAEAGLRDALAAAGVRGCVNRVGSMLTLFLGVDGVRDFQSALRADTAAFGRFFLGMLDRGRLPAAVAVRGHVPVAGARRDGHRPAGRSCPPGARGSLIWPGSSSATRYARGMAMAFEFTGTIAAGAFLGWYLDESFRVEPVGVDRR